MASTAIESTIAGVAPKSLISVAPALSDIFSASEDEQEDRDDELLRRENSDGFFSERQGALPSYSNAPDGSQQFWVCLRDSFPLSEESAGFYSWCHSSFFAKGSEDATTGTASCSSSQSGIEPKPMSPTTTATIDLDDHNTTVCQDDDDSITTFTTFGSRIFGDLGSLPSLATQFSPIKDKSDSLMSGPAGDRSALLARNLRSSSLVNMKHESNEDSSTIASGYTLTSDTLEQAVDAKLREVNADEVIGDTQKSEIELLRTSSSASARSFMKKKVYSPVDKVSEQSMASGQSSQAATSLSSPRSMSHRGALVRELKGAIEEHGRFDVRCANIACLLAEIHEKGNENTQAMKLYHEATTIYTTKLGDHHTTTIDAKLRLGQVLEKIGDYDRAIELYFGIHSMQKEVLGDTHACVPDTLSHLASALKRKGQTAQAIKELKRALKLYRGSRGDSHPVVTATVDEISTLYMILGDYNKASAILEEVVKLKAATNGQNHEEVGKTLLQLATAYEAAGENSKALRTLKKGYSVFSSVHGDSSEQANMVLERIAQNCKNSGDTDRAVAAYLGVLRGQKALHGDMNPIVADTYFHLGIALGENSQLDKAMKCMKQALFIYVGEGKSMDDVEMIARVMYEMALIHRSKGQLADALKILKQVLGIRKKMGDRELPRVADTLFQIGTTELQMKNQTRALNHLMEALSIFEKTSEEVGVDFAKTLYCTGIIFEGSGRLDRAQEAYNESIKLFQAQGLSDAQICDFLSRLDKLKTPGTQRKRTNRHSL